jgi:hypothetical protein
VLSKSPLPKDQHKSQLAICPLYSTQKPNNTIMIKIKSSKTIYLNNKNKNFISAMLSSQILPKTTISTKPMLNKTTILIMKNLMSYQLNN